MKRILLAVLAVMIVIAGVLIVISPKPYEKDFSCEKDYECKLFDKETYGEVSYTCSYCDCGGERINLSLNRYVAVDKDFNRLQWYKRLAKRWHGTYFCDGMIQCLCERMPPVYVGDMYQAKCIDNVCEKVKVESNETMN